MADKQDQKALHEIIAKTLMEQLARGAAPWQRRWDPDVSAGLPMNPTTGIRYKGINAIILAAQDRNDRRWMTAEESQKLGAEVRQGETGTPVMYWHFSKMQDKLDANGKPLRNSDGDNIQERARLQPCEMFLTSVFNAEQIIGLPPPVRRSTHLRNPADRAEQMLEASGATIRHGNTGRPFYDVASDTIHLPAKSQFISENQYYTAAVNQLFHWTGHASRLERDMTHPFGSEGHSREALRAGIFSMFMAEELGTSQDPAQHAAHTNTWIKILEEDPTEILRAANDAESALAYLHGLEQQRVQEQAAAEQTVDLRIMRLDEALKQDVADVWTLQHLEAGTLTTVLETADARQLEYVKSVLYAMQPLDEMENEFWSQHKLPADSRLGEKIYAASVYVADRHFALSGAAGELFDSMYPDGYPTNGKEDPWIMRAAGHELAKRQHERILLQERVASRAEEQFGALPPEPRPTAYTVEKGIQPTPGVRTHADGTLHVPAYDANGKLWAVQTIGADGREQFPPYGRRAGCFHPVGGFEALERAPVLVIGQSYATAASLAHALDHATVAAFESGNLQEVAESLHKKFPGRPVIIAGDDDRHLSAARLVNQSRSDAALAAHAVKGKAVFPIFAPGEVPEHLGNGQYSDTFTSFNDLASRSVLGAEGLKRQIGTAVDVALLDKATQLQSRRLKRAEKRRQQGPRPKK